jgi:mannan endo-1,4-beta-mannosidase
MSASRSPRFLRPFPLVAAVALLLALALPAAGSAKAGANASKLNGRTDLAAQRSLGGPPSCKAARASGARASSSRRRILRRIAKRCHPAAPAAPVSLYWGASIGDQLSGDQPPWDMSALSEFEGMTGKGLSLVHFMAPFAQCTSSRCSYYDFPAKEMEGIRQHGSIPFFSWSSQSIPSSLDEPNFQLSDVIAGTYDSYIREWATEAKAWGHPFFLRFNWEMNGNWFPWSEGVNGNQPGEYVAAWRHVHDIFTAVGATNATWVWCPNVDPNHKMQDLASVYPGNEYVDWTSLDGYNWGTNPAKPDRWRSFDELYDSTYDEIVEGIAPAKPMVIGEVGSTEYGGSKAEWIEEMLAELPTEYPQIRGLLWFEKYDDGMDWPIETSTTATGAFARGIQSPSYLGNQFGGLGDGPIPPPS